MAKHIPASFRRDRDGDKDSSRESHESDDSPESRDN
jgi:hypothetical protein